MELESWHYTARCHSGGRIGIRMPGAEHVLSREEAEKLFRSLGAELGNSVELLMQQGGEEQPKAKVGGRYTPPYSNCKYQMCDLPGQCRTEGRCHHPASSAPTAMGTCDPIQDLKKSRARAALARFSPSIPAPGLFIHL